MPSAPGRPAAAVDATGGRCRGGAGGRGGPAERRPRPRPPTGRRARRPPASPPRAAGRPRLALAGEDAAGGRREVASSRRPRPAPPGPAVDVGEDRERRRWVPSGARTRPATSSGPDRAQQADDRPVTGGAAQQLDPDGQAGDAGGADAWRAGPAGPRALSRPRPEGGRELAGVGDRAQDRAAAGERRRRCWPRPPPATPGCPGEGSRRRRDRPRRSERPVRAGARRSGGRGTGCRGSRVVCARQGRSSRRTMSSPVRAVARQWTFRRSSPWRYSRVLTSSSPWTAMVRRAPSPPPPCPPAGPPAPSGRTRGTTSSGEVSAPTALRSTSPNGSTSRSRRGPSTWRPRRWPCTPVAQRGGRPVRQPLDQEPGRAAEVAGHVLGEQPQPARAACRRW